MKDLTKLFIPLLFIGLPSCSPGTTTESPNLNEEHLVYADYIDVVAENVKSLTLKQVAARDSVKDVMEKTKLYQELVLKKKVSQEYLPLLEGLGELMSTYDGEIVSLTGKIQEYIEGKEGQKEFLMQNIMLITRGGITKEVIEVLDRYQKQFGYYGDKGNLVVTADNQQTTIERDFDLTPAFGVIDSENPKVLDAIYLVHQNGITDWQEGQVDTKQYYPYIHWKAAYQQHLRKHYPNSQYYQNYDYELTAQQLYQVYDDNEVAADEKYKGKNIAVTGQILDIKKDIMNETYILLESGDYIRNIQCYFPDNKTAANLAKGEKITLVGECNGLMMNVILKNCKIL